MMIEIEHHVFQYVPDPGCKHERRFSGCENWCLDCGIEVESYSSKDNLRTGNTLR